MAHCPIEMLADLAEVLAEVRTWEHVLEKSPGVFYVKRLPFLHFHVNKEGARWADCRKGKTWGPPLPIDPPSTAAARKAFLRALVEYHAATLDAVAPKRR